MEIDAESHIKNNPKHCHWLTALGIFFLVFVGLLTLYCLFSMPLPTTRRDNSFESTLRKIRYYYVPLVKNYINKQSEPKWYLLKKSLFFWTETGVVLPRYPSIVSWGDFIFYSDNNYSTNVQVFSYNFNKAEKGVIYNQKERQDFKDQKTRYPKLKVIKDTLFISVGGYLVNGSTFWLDLPPDGQSVKLLINKDPEIKLIKNHYWLVYPSGKACFDANTYSLLDVETKAITPIIDTQVANVRFGEGALQFIETQVACEGDEYLGIDSEDRMILAHHTGGAIGPDYLPGSPGVFQYIYAIPLSDAKSKVTLLSSSQMPKDTSKITFNEEKNQLILQGKSTYIFDLFTSTVTDAVPASSVELLPSPYVPTEERDSDQSIIEGLKLPENYKFVLR